ncbi:hypothetical protein PRUPE_2G018000 [Prunus persica]|uniref:Spermidine hydroxycinnamoyl transferase n=1 Tax=Prunus persica TaxID=3760 RepID=A0A251QAQ4_PRUPE|nr:hypothetical protein PRUPE_2G018000 [Prunus persica]
MLLKNTTEALPIFSLQKLSLLILLSKFFCALFINHIANRPDQHCVTPTDAIANTLKDSLRRALVPFYPLAGRLRWIEGGRLELDCNGMGVEFIEAESDLKLDDLGDFSPSPEYHSLFPTVDYNLPFHELPLLFVQLTRFKCGGFSLGLEISHAVTNGQSACHFIGEWAKLTRGEPIGVMPFLDGQAFLARHLPAPTQVFDHIEFNQPPILLGQSDNLQESKMQTTLTMLKLTKEQVDKLKQMANEACFRVIFDFNDSYSLGIRVGHLQLAGHIWRCALRSRNHKDEQPTALMVCVDLRSRMKPQLPQGYFGNAVFYMPATSLADDLLSKPLGYVLSRIREAVEKVTMDYVLSAHEKLKNEPDLTRFQDLHYAKESERGPFNGNPNIGVLNWLTLLIYGLDFGWGKEIYMGPGPHDFDGDSLILPEMVLWLWLQVAHIDVFKKHFYEDII